jgi:L-fucose isomerase-like protein
MKLKIGLVGAAQANFDGGKEAVYARSAEGLAALGARLGFDLYVHPAFVVTAEDAMRAREAVEGEGVDFLLVQTTTFAAGEVILHLGRTRAAIGLWGLPEASFEGSVFVNSRNSLCGIKMYAGILAGYLRDYAIKYKWFYGYVDDEWFVRRFELTARALSAIKRLRHARVALVGGIAPGFNDLYFDERVAQKRLGVEIQRNHEFSEIKQRALSYREAELEEDRKAACSGCAGSDASGQNIEVHARFTKAYRDFCLEYGYEALGVSCWPKMQDETLSLSCSVIAKLNEYGIPAACEGDLPGAISMLLMRYLTEAPATLMDLSGIDEADQSVLMWHCGPSPACYADGCGACLTYSHQPRGDGTIKKIGLIHDMVFAPAHATFMRVTGEWDTMFLCDGDFVGPGKPSPVGSRGWLKNLRLNREGVSVRDFLNTLMVRGFQHHYPMMAGDITRELMEAAAWLGLGMLRPVPYQDYLQTDVR